MNQSETVFQYPEEDPLGRPPVVVARAPHRTEMDAIRMILAEEGVPSLVEQDHHATPPDWTVQVSEAAGDDARRLLENRAAMASHIDWDAVDVGTPPAEVRSILEGAERMRRFNTVVRVAGTVVGLTMLVLAIVAVLATLLT
ncbi:MAG: hypothetical protein O3A19_08715 [Planctomycetota bacterium]|nr:hypothetical protein [Planctomycetota bacterium]MDA1026495.1 hypothetical protein [Planctomycetota bacterium]